MTKKIIGVLVFSKKYDKTPIEKINSRFIEEIELAGYQAEIFYYDQFSVFFERNKINLYYGNKKFSTQKIICIISQYYFLNAEFSTNMFIVKCLADSGIKVFNSLNSVLLAKNKRETLYKLSQADLPIIPTGINFSQFFLDQQLAHFGKNKIVAKANNGSMGYGVSLLNSSISFISFMEFIGNIYQPSNILIQPFIEVGGEDYRIFVVGNKVITAMKRKAKGIEFRANVSKGGIGSSVKITKNMEKLALQATKILGLDYSGVDIIKDKKGKLYIVEVNSNPGFKIETATNINVVKEIIKHCIKKSK